MRCTIESIKARFGRCTVHVFAKWCFTCVSLRMRQRPYGQWNTIMHICYWNALHTTANILSMPPSSVWKIIRKKNTVLCSTIIINFKWQIKWHGLRFQVSGTSTYPSILQRTSHRWKVRTWECNPHFNKSRWLLWDINCWRSFGTKTNETDSNQNLQPLEYKF